jgi:hypothetical protein
VRAVKEFRGKTIGSLNASKMFNVPKVTLKEPGTILTSKVSAVWIFILRKEERNGHHDECAG